MEGLVEVAKEVAHQVHLGQTRRDGVTPYINHPAAVAAKFPDDPMAAAVAWLHDTLEDGMVRDILEGVNPPLPQEVKDAVVAMTHERGESYFAYLKRLKKNPLAVKVKKADMLHNLSDTPTERQILKYAKGLVFLIEG